MSEPDPSTESTPSQPESTTYHPIATGLGTTGGAVAGAAIGHAIAGKMGAAVGGVAGALAGGVAGNAVAELTEELIQETVPSLSLGLGADRKEIELPTHYSWEELQALSKPQVENANLPT
ncbi:MAG: hypothetical protein ACM37W_19725 [Actinomycetota bacterium]